VDFVAGFGDGGGFAGFSVCRSRDADGGLELGREPIGGLEEALGWWADEAVKRAAEVAEPDRGAVEPCRVAEEPGRLVPARGLGRSASPGPSPCEGVGQQRLPLLDAGAGRLE